MTRVLLEQVSKHFGKFVAVDGVSLEILNGEFFTLLGPSGCGKTTILRMIAGFEKPTEGRLCFDSNDMTFVPPHKRGTGMVFQDYALFPDKTVRENVAYGLRARGEKGDGVLSKVRNVLEKVELAHLEKRLPAQLSGGQKQRVALARALVIEPTVLLMDEPLSNLDAKLRIGMREMVRKLQQDVGITTIFVTHDQEEALALSDRIAVMKQGELVQVGPPTEVYTQPADSFVADFIGSANLLPISIESTDGPENGVTCRYGKTPFILNKSSLMNGKKQNLLLCGRPEQIKLAKPGEDEPGVPGEIQSIQYLGYMTTFSIVTAEKHTIRVDVPGGSAARKFEMNSPVEMQFSRNCWTVEG